MKIMIYIAPHERNEAIEAYRECLTDAQVNQIEEAPEGAGVQLTFTDTTEIKVIPNLPT